MTSRTPSTQAIAALLRFASKERAATNARFFKSGKGQYGEGDAFIGVTVPDIRKIAKSFIELPISEGQKLLQSRIHEVRFLGVIIWTMQFAKGDHRVRKTIFDAYLAQSSRINNWDLVDVSAPRIVGEWLADTYTLNATRSNLTLLAKSSLLWERRIAIVATYAFIRRGDASTTFTIADIVINDREDLIHKAAGWMLREVGKRCGRKILVDYLKPRYKTMPRTMLRYAIEHFSAVERRGWLLGKV